MATATVERDGTTLRIVGELDFDSVADLWVATGSLFEIEVEPVVQIDLSGVRRSNSAGVALLVEWLRQAQSRQSELIFSNMPAQMRAIVRVVDLETVLPVA
ncbi:MAG: STAS domain-containing protein [Candidatus Competibacter denitrificans]|jgi:phospholipid transport system transporter-binding protein